MALFFEDLVESEDQKEGGHGKVEALNLDGQNAPQGPTYPGTKHPVKVKSTWFKYLNVVTLSQISLNIFRLIWS